MIVYSNKSENTSNIQHHPDNAKIHALMAMVSTLKACVVVCR